MSLAAFVFAVTVGVFLLVGLVATLLWVTGVIDFSEMVTAYRRGGNEMGADWAGSGGVDSSSPSGSLLNGAAALVVLCIIIAESERLAQLSTTVRNLSKYEHTMIIADKTLFCLSEQIRRALLMTQPKWEAKDIRLDIEMDELTFVGNEELTQQIWLNLLDNAIKFSPEKGAITIRLARCGSGSVGESGTGNGGGVGVSEMRGTGSGGQRGGRSASGGGNASGDGIRFSIRDTGPGIPIEMHERIFDKFYQGDLSHAKTGNGLGLAIVKRIVELYEGTLELQSEPGKGSEFTVTLPG